MRIGLLIILFFIPPLLISAQPEKYTRIEIPCSLENIEEVYAVPVAVESFRSVPVVVPL